MANEPTSDVFTGPDRVEHCAPLGRPIRKGEPAQLSVSDHARVRAALQRQDFAATLASASGLDHTYTAITATFLEWCLAMPAMLAHHGHAERERAITRDSHRRWMAGVSTNEDGPHTPLAIKVMAGLLAPDSLSPETVADYRARQAAGEPNRATRAAGAAQDALRRVRRGRDPYKVRRLKNHETF